MLDIFHSNRLEILMQRLTHEMAQPSADPFLPDMIVVQNEGMARWINQQLALAWGVSTCIRYPLPASFFWKVLKAWIPDAPESTLFDKDALLWRILEVLPACLANPAFAPLSRYLHQDHAETKLFQLARRIADLFDQYLVFRPDKVLAWENGAENHWQAQLWRALGEGGDSRHRARLFADLEQAMATSQPQPGALPERVSLFGLTALAPVYVRMLGRLAQFIPVRIYYLNPCQEYWADIMDERGQQRRRARAERAGQADPTEVLDVGNPLLATLGHAGQVFLDQLLELNGADHDHFAEPAGHSLLHELQRDILHLTNPQERRLIDPQDRSLHIHSTHGRLREIQVLHDRLLDQFAHFRDLEPRDIIVMAPDIDLYAPYIETVFGTARPGIPLIPWSIADRRIGAVFPLVGALELLLKFDRNRWESSLLLSLLEFPAVRRRFGLNENDIEQIRLWTRETGVRWGENAAMRDHLGLPPEPANTWAFGLDRLFLGYALPADPDAEPFANIVPYTDVEGSSATNLGLLQAFLDLLHGWRVQCLQAHTLEDWRDQLGDLLLALFAPDADEAPLLQRIRDQLDHLVKLAQRAGFGRPLSLDVLRSLLETVFTDTQGSQRFLTGRVTFCNMVPMRSIPFRVVALIGMNGDEFPRSQRPLSFDLMAAAPRRGDRSRRRDDRYLFLEALLSARDLLYLSYIGNDVRDNSLKVPSGLISELLDYVRQTFTLEGGQTLLDEHLCLRHPLQPFNRAYFHVAPTRDASNAPAGDPRLFSYDPLWAQAARVKPDAKVPPFIEHPLPEAEPAWRTVDLDALIRFFRNPAQFFLTERLGVRLPQAEEWPEDVEPFHASGLELYAVRQILLRQHLRGQDSHAILTRLRGQGLLPHGEPGALLFEKHHAAVQPFVECLKRYRTQALEPLEIDLALGGFRLQGMLGGRQHGGWLDGRFGKLRAQDRLSMWIKHLLLQLRWDQTAGDGPVSYFVAEDAILELGPVDHAQTLLLDLLELRWQGLHAPLRFFPQTSLAHCDKKKYLEVWSGERNPAAEARDQAVRLAFRGQDPLAEPFGALAERIARPMLEHSKLLPLEQETHETA